MAILSTINCPADVRALSPAQLEELAVEIRSFLVEKVCATGGHLGPNLGVVELTLALHRVFDSPHDPILFDTSHQSYVHKIVTGRKDRFGQLRMKGGLSGYTSPHESPHDWTESSHASAALSIADGMAKAFALEGQSDRRVIAVVGDGALTGGMCWEALNNIAANKERNVVIVVNDNGRSYSPTIGGLADNLASLRMQPFYDKVMEQGKETLNQMGWFGRRTFKGLQFIKEGVRHAVLPSEMFPELGMKYVGPVDGHSLRQLQSAFRYAKTYSGPIIIHCVTEKGRGFAPAEQNLADLMHSTGIIDPSTGQALTTPKPGWTAIFTDELLTAGRERDDIVAITAAMAGPTGLAKFAEEFPDRTFDVGIAEQHAVASAAGLAIAGMHPVVAVYSTFLNRAFDQLLMDVGLMHLPVTVVLDRAGVTGSDGASHNGVWDMSVTGIIPGLKLAAPRDGEQLRIQLREAFDTDDAPTVVRFPKGSLPEPISAVASFEDGTDILLELPVADEKDDNPQEEETETRELLIVAIGVMAGVALKAATRVKALHPDWSVTVVDPRWPVPVPPALIDLAGDCDLVVTVEDGLIHGGAGTFLMEALSAAGYTVPVRQAGISRRFLAAATRAEILHDEGLDVEGLTASIHEWIDEAL